MNLRRLAHVLLEEEGARKELAFISINIIKAFDTVDWQYLGKVLMAMGIGPVFRAWVQLLYTNPIASVSMESLGSQTWAIERGTSQGCPLSPLLFALALELLAVQIRKSLAD